MSGSIEPLYAAWAGAGEISLTLSAHGRDPIDLWPAAGWLEEAGGT